MDKTIDKQNMYSALKNFSSQIRDGWRLAENFKFEEFNRIIITGMGGSCLFGEILKSYLFKNFKIPIDLNKNYTLPEHINKKTLLIVSSYSGNTEEAIEAFRFGNRKGCQIISFHVFLLRQPKLLLCITAQE